MNKIVSRTFADAFFAMKADSKNAIFFEGGSCRIAQRLMTDPNYMPTQTDFPEYDPSCWSNIEEDCSSLRSEITEFLTGDTPPIPGQRDKPSEPTEDTPLARLKTYAKTYWQLTSADVELTHLCNCRCRFCYLASYENSGLRLEELQRIGSALKDAGVIFTSLTGGELFLRPDAMDILQLFTDLNFMLEIKSNGTLLDAAKIETLARLPIFDMQISIYETADGFSATTQRSYPFTQVTESIKQLASSEVPLTLSVTVGKHNVDRLDEIHHALKQIADIAIFYSPYITPRRSGADDGITFRLSTTEMQEKLLPFLRRTGNFSKMEPYRDCTACLHPCTAGITQVAIDPLGNLYPCLDLPVVIGNVRHGDVDTLLSSATRGQAMSRFRMADMAQCLECDVREYCDSCVGISLLENGTHTRPARHKCDVVRFFTLNEP
ncbi:MAG: radical SAM protein [Candidatus Peribacteraceae bacterium]|nr:radical SAM protein [Candidatus Peribacteraceae bacterium]